MYLRRRYRRGPEWRRLKQQLLSFPLLWGYLAKHVTLEASTYTNLHDTLRFSSFPQHYLRHILILISEGWFSNTVRTKKAFTEYNFWTLGQGICCIVQRGLWHQRHQSNLNIKISLRISRWDVLFWVQDLVSEEQFWIDDEAYYLDLLLRWGERKQED